MPDYFALVRRWAEISFRTKLLAETVSKELVNARVNWVCFGDL